MVSFILLASITLVLPAAILSFFLSSSFKKVIMGKSTPYLSNASLSLEISLVLLLIRSFFLIPSVT